MQLPSKSATGTGEGGRLSHEQKWFTAHPGIGEDWRRRWAETFQPEPTQPSNPKETKP